MLKSDNSIVQALADRDFDRLIESIPYAQMIGVKCMPIGDTSIFCLPQNDDNIGNPTLPALHGGVIAGFMETAAVLHVMMATNTQSVPKIVDFSIDYLSPGRNYDSYAECVVVRQGRKIVNVIITAWQSSREKPTATARAHFLLDPS
jgi:uncharacterized protein (TIGR00369 family)